MSRIPPATGRRAFLASGAAFLAAPALAQTTNYTSPFENSTLVERDPTVSVRRNISSFRSLDWRPYFSNTRGGAVLVYPTSVPLTPELTKLGRTEIVKKVVGPEWRPTPSMKERNPEWPDFVGPGPDNPLGTHALYLSWTYYRIHGTHDTRKIGRKSSNGCIGLYNEHIAELFGLTNVGTQVLLI